MLLYCGGDAHVSGAEVVNNHITAGTDPKWSYLGPLPHPDNVKSAWPRKLADILKVALKTGEAARSVHDVISDVTQWVGEMHSKDLHDLFVIIGWDITASSDHKRIYALHEAFNAQGVPHLFFNTNKAFFKVPVHHKWGESYIEPYNRQQSYTAILQAQKFQTVSPDSQYFGKEAHSFWAVFLLQYIMKTNLVKL